MSLPGIGNRSLASYPSDRQKTGRAKYMECSIGVWANNEGGILSHRQICHLSASKRVVGLWASLQPKKILPPKVRRRQSVPRVSFADKAVSSVRWRPPVLFRPWRVPEPSLTSLRAWRNTRKGTSRVTVVSVWHTTDSKSFLGEFNVPRQMLLSGAVAGFSLGILP
jgi:hypothetical protein